MTNWCKYVLRTAQARRGDPKLPEEVDRFLWNTGFHFGEWLIPSDKKGISQREACEGSAYYIAPIFGYLSIRMMAEVARILEKPDAECARVHRLAVRLAKQIIIIVNGFICCLRSIPLTLFPPRLE